MSTYFSESAINPTAVGLGADISDTRMVNGIMRTTGDFDAFYQAQYGRLVGSLRLLAGNNEVAEELAQEAFIRAFSKWDTVTEMESPGGWLYRTAFNLARRRWRLNARVAKPSGREAELVSEPTADWAELTDALRRLPIKQRTAVVTRYVLGYSTEEAAEILDMSPGALRVMLHRATAALRIDPSLATKATES